MSVSTSVGNDTHMLFGPKVERESVVLLKMAGKFRRRTAKNSWIWGSGGG